MAKYTAITIGPIFDTMNLASIPAALWAASYMFSYLAKSICSALVTAGLPAQNIVTPFFESEKDAGETTKELLHTQNGVGLFPDRIIFSRENLNDVTEEYKIDLGAVKEDALMSLSNAFELDIDHLREYVMIADADFEGENPILEGGLILDSLELAKPFVHQKTTDPLLTLFEKMEPLTGEQAGDSAFAYNEAVKNLPIVKGLADWQLWKTPQKSLKSLEDIASQGKKLSDSDEKKDRYYAIVRSDGDNMSRLIASLDTPAKIRNFSHQCLSYCAAIANAVKAFGGVTIYAGGDDLLALLPCESSDGSTVFSFIEQANRIFDEHFREKDFSTYPPTETVNSQLTLSLSFGIFISYYKFPLYEALEESAKLLFYTAKTDEYGKNCTAIRLSKHAGQSAGIVIRNGESLKAFLNLQTKVLKAFRDEKKEKMESKSKVLLSALHKIALLEPAFRNVEALSAGMDDPAKAAERMNRNLFKNTFDDPDAHGIPFLENDLPQVYVDLASSVLDVRPLTDPDLTPAEIEAEKKEPKCPSVVTLCSMLRILKFFVESAGDK